MRRILHAQNASNKEKAMELSMKSPVVALQAGQVLTLDDAAGTRIVSRSGTVWVTQEDDATDHIVRAGDAMILARGGRTVIQALQAAWISLLEAPRAANDLQSERARAEERLLAMRDRLSRYY
jgi:hypothetical protein